MRLNDIKRRRTVISSFFITVLFGIAFKESAAPIWEILKATGIYNPSVDWILPYIFIITAIRFFIGNQLHLLEIEKEPALSPFIWLLDFGFIVLESFIFIFIAKTCSLKISVNIKAGFFDFIKILLIIDISWLILQILLGIIHKKWKRKVCPLGWAILNIFTIGIILTFSYKDILYNWIGLIILASIFTMAAIIDVIIMDHYGLLRR